MRLAVTVYSTSDSFPRDERFCLTQQIRRAVVSIPSNIAEGRGRGTARDYRQFVLRARASAFEVQTQLLIAASLEYLAETAAEEIIGAVEEVIRMINGLIRYLDQREQ